MVVHSLNDLARDDDGDAAVDAPHIDGERMAKEFAGVYHEKQVRLQAPRESPGDVRRASRFCAPQVGSLCAVHALNNLLQGPHVDEVMLADIARGLDDQERSALGGGRLEAESANVRADGFFSVQVLSMALQQLGLTCTPIGADSMRDAASNPAKERGFICNRSGSCPPPLSRACLPLPGKRG